MTAAIILWSHALAALAFAVTALAAWRQPGTVARPAFGVALLLSALWGLAMAGIDPNDLSTRLTETARNLAWLVFMLAVVRRARAGNWALTAVFCSVAAVVAIGAGLAVAEAGAATLRVQENLAVARNLFRMMAAAGALVLVLHLCRAIDVSHRGGLRIIALALGGMWATDLVVSTMAHGMNRWPAELVAARGIAHAGIAMLLAVAVGRLPGAWSLTLSRPATMRVLSGVALMLYLAGVSAVTDLAGTWGGGQARALQAGVVIGAAAGLLALLSTSWLGAWMRVKLAKHLFRHRYDYRTEWQRFTDRLGGGGAPLEERVAQAVAELLDAPASLLLTPDGTQTPWRWEAAPVALDAALSGYLASSRRIVELDAVRAGDASEDGRVPEWILARGDAWALVPLLHGDELTAVVVLARPPVARQLDWEDFDLLRVAGRQAASYLAEDRAGRALAEARRFDEFHRRFAFILHDIKNLVSQQQLVARNAERHAHNPAFRADMIATLRDSADRMISLIARLSQAEPAAPEPLAALDGTALLRRVTAVRRRDHAVVLRADAACWAMGHPQRLEQVIGHLLQNAIDASGAGSPVTLSATCEDGRAVLEVADRGVGMDAVFIRDQLFRPFASTKVGGFGIGAFEARQLVTAMGGELRVDSLPGQGTTFRVVLPAVAAPVAAA